MSNDIYSMNPSNHLKGITDCSVPPRSETNLPPDENPSILNPPETSSPLSNLTISIPQSTQSSSPKPQFLKSPYSPIRISHTNGMRDKYLYSPYKCSTPKSQASSPNRDLDKTAFSVHYHDYMQLETTKQPTRKRSQSLGYYKHPVKDSIVPPLPNSHLIQFPPTSPIRRRSQSLDLSSLRRSPRSKRFSRVYSLTLEFERQYQHLSFSGTTLEELKNAINGCFSVLPVVHVCIEHPFIPNHLVNITDLDQLYDNAVIHLIPLAK